MAYDLEEQEQLANLKAFWKQYGNLITWVLVIALSAYAAWNGWNLYQSKQAAQASQLYEELQKASLVKDTAKTLRIASDIQEKFSASSYADLAAFTAAKLAFDGNDLKSAKTQLQWVITHNKAQEMVALAKLRLAGVELDEKNFDAAMKLLAGEFPAEFAADVADRKGDILFAQNKFAEANAEYKKAIEKLGDKNPAAQLVQIKLDATQTN